MVATHNNLLKVLSEGTIALHFAGHGVKNSIEYFNLKDNPNLKG